MAIKLFKLSTTIPILDVLVPIVMPLKNGQFNFTILYYYFSNFTLTTGYVLLQGTLGELTKPL